MSSPMVNVLDPGHDGPAMPERVNHHAEPISGDEGCWVRDDSRSGLDGALEDVVDAGAVDHRRMADDGAGLRGDQPLSRHRVAELEASCPEVQLGVRN